jgi:hypothetical protein
MSRERTPASRWRVAVGRQLGALYAAQPNVAAMLIGGSAARGLSDGYSDLELGVFWHTPPTEAERRAVPTAAGADYIQLYPYDAQYDLWEDTYFVGRAAPDQPDTGLLVEVEHYTVAGMESILQAVLVDLDPDEVKHSLLSILGAGLSVYGQDLLAGWAARAAPYPDALAAKLVRQYGQIEFTWRVEKMLARGDNLPEVYSDLNRMTGQLLRTLLALNRQYYSGFKWLDYVLDSLPLKPVDCGARLRRVFAGDPLAGHGILVALIEETYDLVEVAFPTMDVAQLRRWFRWQRPVWEAPPPTLRLDEEAC